MPTVQSWEVSDGLWSRVERLLPRLDPRAERKRRFRRKPGGGRKPISPREIFAAIVYVLRTGCQWKALPRVLAAPAPFITTSKSGGQQGFFVRLWRAGLAEYDELEGIAWEWQSLDGTQGKAPLAQEAVGNNPTDRGKKKGPSAACWWTAVAPPLSLIVAGANRHDVKLLAQTLDAIVIQRPKPTKKRPQNLCVDKGYRGKVADQQMRARGYIPHIPTKTPPRGGHKTKGRARRWVVERTHSWMNNYRKLRVRYEKKVANFEALLHLATAMICWRM
jgi:putative transposase